MVGRKGRSGRRPPSAAVSDVNDGGDGSSANSSAPRPNQSFTLPRELLEKLRGLNKREMSRFVEKAVIRQFAHNEQFEKLEELLFEAATHLHLKRDLLEFRNEQIDGRLVSLDERLASLESDTRYIVRVLERLFHLRRHPIEVEVPSARAFDELKHEATGEYLRDADLLRPNIHRREHDLEMAAEMEAFANRKAEVQSVLSAMPFMSDPRFYVGPALRGLALFDREYQFKESSWGEAKDFEVFSVQLDRGASLIHSKTRPYARFGVLDNREIEVIEGIEKIAQIVPVLVADYLSFRRLDGEVPGAPSLLAVPPVSPK